jgi:hypothetical protein
LNGKWIKRLTLTNGLILDLLDESKKIAGDRWQVSVTARVEIPVNRESLGPDAGLDVNEANNLLGATVVFEQKQRRNFIDMKEKEPLVEKMVSSFSALGESYLSHPGFAGKVVLKQLAEMKKRQTWYPQEPPLEKQE